MSRQLASASLTALFLVAACGSPSDGGPGSIGQVESALTAEDCLAGADNGKVAICHATGSASTPWVLTRVNTNGCVSGHARHAGDYLAGDDVKCVKGPPKSCAIGTFAGTWNDPATGETIGETTEGAISGFWNNGTRPDFFGQEVMDGSCTANVTFPDDATFVATLVNACTINWSNNTTWVKVNCTP